VGFIVEPFESTSYVDNNPTIKERVFFKGALPA
jgi:hypothetical protein